MTTFPGGLHGAHLRTDLIALIGRHRLNGEIAAGSLKGLWPRVVVEARRATDPRTRGAASLLAFGPDAVLTGLTAAHLHGCGAAASPSTHLLLPYERYVRPRSGLVVHHARSYRDDVELVDGLRLLALDRVVADLLCSFRTRPADALAVCDEALAHQPAELREQFRARIGRRIEDRQDPRGTRIGPHLLELATGRAESPAESWLLLQVVEAGFPWPEVNWGVLSPWGEELYRLDLAWPELRIAVEYHGYAVHAGRETQDAARRTDLERRGWIVVIADADDLRHPGSLAVRLNAAFARRGYMWPLPIRQRRADEMHLSR